MTEKISAISLSWNANFLQRKDQIGHYSEYVGKECKVNETAEKLLEIGAADEIIAYTNPEWLTLVEIEKKYVPRVKKLAKAIGYDVERTKFVPRNESDSSKGTAIFKFTKNLALSPETPKPKSDDELRQIGFKNASGVSEGQVIEIRYTNSNQFFRVIGKVVRVNPKSIRVKGNYEFTHYFSANTANNGAFLIPDGKLAEITASVDKFMADEKKKKEIIDEVMKDVKFEIKPTIDFVSEETGERVTSISLMDMAHPTTVDGMKAKAQLEEDGKMAKIRNNAAYNVLGNEINKKLKEQGFKEL